MTPESLLPVAVEAIELASNLIATRPPGVLTSKGDRDYASEVDYAVERTVREFLQAKTPGVGFLGEEEGSVNTQLQSWWTLDPIDGTVNYAHGLPLCGASLALIQGDRPVLGVIDLPFLDARYAAVEGHGAFHGSKQLQVSSTDRLIDAVVTVGDYATGADSEATNNVRLAVTQKLANRALRIRMVGSAAIDLVWLAEGKADASVTLSNRSWDVAAGVIIAREAGAQVFDLDGVDHTMRSGSTIAATPGLRHELTRLLAATPT